MTTEWEHVEDYKGCRIEVAPDYDPQDPWEGDNVARMWCWHRRYNFGDDHKRDSIPDFSSMDEAEAYIRENYDVVWLTRIRMYEHSQIGISLMEQPTGYPWNCPWDSGWLGFYFLDKERIREFYMCKRVTDKVIKQAIECAKAEFEEYAAYVEGDAFGYRVVVDDGSEEDGEVIDSCWGFFGYLGSGKGYMLETARAFIDYYRKTHLEQPYLPGMEKEAA